MGLVRCPIDSLGKLKYVNTQLDIKATQIEDLGNLEYVELLDARNTPLAMDMTEDEIRNKLNDDVEIMI